MGEHFEFRCANCGFYAEVSGGDDAGMEAVTTTIVCEDCRRLYDVITTEMEDRQNPKERALRCPVSAKHTIKRWKTGDPCTKCGKPLMRGGRVCLWD
jgi:hypothetical protein